MKIILIAIVASMLLMGLVAAEDPIDLSTKGRKAAATSSVTPIEIKYAPKTTTSGIEPIDVSTLGSSFGSITVSKEVLALGGPTPVTYTPPFSISVSNRTYSRTSTLTPPFSVGNMTVFTPPIHRTG